MSTRNVCTSSALVSALVLSLACGIEGWGPNSGEIAGPASIPMDAPFVSATYMQAGKKEEYFLRRQPGVPITEVLDLSIFGDFSPGVTFEEATSRFGAPDRIREEGESTYHDYLGPRGRVEVGWEVYRSTGAPHRAWRLRAYPVNNTVAEILPRAVAHLPSPEGVTATHYVFLGEDNRPEVGVEVKENEVARITWYSSAGERS